MAVKLGLDCKLYYCTDGIAAGLGANWTEITAARDVNCPITKGEADVTTRGSGKWKQTIGTAKDASIDFGFLYDPADPVHAALLAAFLNDSVVGLCAARGDLAASPTPGYFMADCQILKFDEKEPLENAVTIDVSAKPTFSANRPVYEPGS